LQKSLLCRLKGKTKKSFPASQKLNLPTHLPTDNNRRTKNNCGYAVSLGKLRPVDPTIFQIENGKLILQHTKDAYDRFNKNLAENINKADANWPGLVAKRAGKKVAFDEAAKPN
jgi:hypothetical protein